MDTKKFTAVTALIYEIFMDFLYFRKSVFILWTQFMCATDCKETQLLVRVTSLTTHKQSLERKINFLPPRGVNCYKADVHCETDNHILLCWINGAWAFTITLFPRRLKNCYFLYFTTYSVTFLFKKRSWCFHLWNHHCIFYKHYCVLYRLGWEKSALKKKYEWKAFITSLSFQPT